MVILSDNESRLKGSRTRLFWMFIFNTLKSSNDMLKRPYHTEWLIEMNRLL